MLRAGECSRWRFAISLAVILTVSALGCGRAAAQFIITEIVDSTGAGAGKTLNKPFSIAADGAGNV